MASTVIAAKARCVEIANGITALQEPVQVSWSFPTREPKKRWVMFAEVEWDDSTWATNQSREETYAIKFWINVQISGGTAEEAERECMRLSEDFENLLKADSRLGIGAVSYTNFVPRQLMSFPSDGYFEGQLEAAVVVKARI